jgi:SAM-dependent methyltransferase
MAREVAPPAYKKTMPFRALRYLVWPLWSKAKYSLLQRKYAANSFDKSFDWRWNTTNFNRIALVNLLVSKFPNCDYLEIGCHLNKLFDSVPVANKVGVDPQQGGNVRKTSDDFFRGNNDKFDVVFIDGLHTYEQVRKDIVNAIKVLKPGGWIAMHDMLPRNWIEQQIPIVTPHEWTGDVWKVAFELAQTEGIDFKIVKIDHGVGVFRLTKQNPSLIDLRDELRPKTFAYLYQNINRLPVVEWQDCLKWLS